MIKRILDAVGFLEVVCEDTGLAALDLAVLRRSAAEVIIELHRLHRRRSRLILSTPPSKLTQLIDTQTQPPSCSSTHPVITFFTRDSM